MRDVCNGREITVSDSQKRAACQQRTAVAGAGASSAQAGQRRQDSTHMPHTPCARMHPPTRGAAPPRHQATCGLPSTTGTETTTSVPTSVPTRASTLLPANASATDVIALAGRLVGLDFVAAERTSERTNGTAAALTPWLGMDGDESVASTTRRMPTITESARRRAVVVGRSVSTSRQYATWRAQGRDRRPRAINRLSRGTQQQPRAQARFCTARRDARQRGCGTRMRT